MYLQLAENEPQELAGFSLRKLSLKKIIKGVGKAASGVVKTAKKLGLAVPRNAYLGLVALNVHGTATKLKRAVEADPERVKKLWEKLGGNFGDLKKTINSGAKKKHLFEDDGEGYESHIVLSEGDMPGTIRVQELSAPAVPAAIAAAAPIIAALAPLVKAFSKPGDQAPGEPALEDKAAQIDPEGYKDPTDPANADMYDAEKGVNVTKSKGVSPVLLVGAAAVAALLIMRKK